MDRSNLVKELSDVWGQAAATYVKNQELVKLGNRLSDKMKGTSRVPFSPFAIP